jgi:type IV secretory pathway TrbD component
MNKSVYRSLNKLMTLVGVDRRLFFIILIASLSVFQVSNSILPAAALFGVLWVFGRAATQADPRLIQILFKSSRFVERYDPAKRLIERGKHV